MKHALGNGVASGEKALAAAVVKRAWDDLHSRDEDRRRSAERFWRNTYRSSLAVWCDVLGLDIDVVRERVREEIDRPGSSRASGKMINKRTVRRL